MTWNKIKSAERIQDLIKSIPVVSAEGFESYLQYRQKSVANTKSSPLDNLGPNKAIVVDGVHVYVHLINHNEEILKDGKESEAAHAKTLEFLHLHYGASDRVIANRNAQRIDFHGSRIHAVVLEPTGTANSKSRVIEALELAQEMMLLSELANKEIYGGKYPAKFRIGIDTGLCVAIDSGTRNESEPLFLGNPANNAAKLADGNESGIIISDNVRKILGIPEYQITSNIIANLKLNPARIVKAIPAKQAEELVKEWKSDIQDQKSHGAGNSSRFSFHYHKPPLETIDYQKLSPSNSIRMSMVSIYADIDGYTNFINNAVQSGGVEDAVKALYVIRKELKNVLQKDYHGRKVRFIGDCIHGLIAFGSDREIDETQTVREATECVAALRSSFNLCKEFFPNATSLGLAIGFELGEIPVSRLGLRGDNSVRLAFSAATISSEKQQERCNGKQTAIGLSAYNIAPSNVRMIFGNERMVPDLDYPLVSMLTANTSAVTINSTPPLRAHCK